MQRAEDGELDVSFLIYCEVSDTRRDIDRVRSCTRIAATADKGIVVETLEQFFILA